MNSSRSFGAASLPAPLRWAVWLLGVEAAAAVVATAILAYQVATEDVVDLTAALAVPAYVLVMAAALAGVAVALARRKPRARAPAIVLQLLGVVVAYVLATAGLLWLSIPASVVALAVIALLLAPATSQALAG